MGNIEEIYLNLKELLQYTLLDNSLWQITLAVIIIVISLAFRQIFVSIVMKYLEKVAKKTKNELDDKIVKAIDPPARLLFVVVGIYLATKVMKLPIGVQNFMLHLVRSLIAFCVFWTAYRASEILSHFFQRLSEKTETVLDDVLLPFVRKGIKVLIVVLAISVIAKEWNYDIGTLLAGLGLGGLAFALAAKDTASNLFGGITIMLDKPFTIGDWIKTPDVEGTVEEMGFRSTKIRTFAQALVSIPNSVLSNAPITNWSRMGKRRITFRLGVTYSTSYQNMQLCLQNLRQMLTSHPDIHPQTIFVYFERYGESSLEIFLYFFTKTTNWQEFLAVQEDVNLKIMKILEELSVSVAFPSRSVYLEGHKGKMGDR